MDLSKEDAVDDLLLNEMLAFRARPAQPHARSPTGRICLHARGRAGDD